MSLFNPVQLIDEIKTRPSLYKADHPADREEKLALWKEIGSVIYHDWNNYNKATAYDRVLQLQRKWRSLRDAYNRELRSRRSGVRVNRKVYRYFKRMSFLGGYDGSISDEETQDDNLKLEAVTSLEDDQNSDTETLPVKKVKKKKKKHHNNEENAPSEIEMPIFPVELAENETDSDRLFLLSFLPEMRQLPLNIKMWVRAQIANVMQEAVSCHYNNSRPSTSLDKNNFDIKRQRQDSVE